MLVLLFQTARLAVFLALLAPLAACAGSHSSIEKIDDGFVSLKGTPSENNPYMDIGCLTGAKQPTLIMHIGSDVTTGPAGAWKVQVGEWEGAGTWERSAHHKKETSHVPNVRMAHAMFGQMVNSDAGSMMVMMNETYTFSLDEDVRSVLRAEFPENCYTSR